MLQVAFDDLPFNSNKTHSQKREYWERSRRLQHGTLVALWWETSVKDTASTDAGQAAREPCIIFAVISVRDPDQLAPKGEPVQRPCIGIRSATSPVAYCFQHCFKVCLFLDVCKRNTEQTSVGTLQSSAKLQALNQSMSWSLRPQHARCGESSKLHIQLYSQGCDAWLTGFRLCQGCGSRDDILLASLGGELPGKAIMLQASGSFFAYEPILKALQSNHSMPLAQYLAAPSLPRHEPEAVLVPAERRPRGGSMLSNFSSMLFGVSSGTTQPLPKTV